jgi:hypothetical protein
MNEARELAAKLARYGPADIEFSGHAILQAEIRQLSLEDIRNNLLRPARLVYAERWPARKAGGGEVGLLFQVQRAAGAPLHNSYKPEGAHSYRHKDKPEMAEEAG